MNVATELTLEKPTPAVRVDGAVRETPCGAGVAAAFLGTAAVPVAIGCLHVLSDAYSGVNAFLTLHTGIGPYSGKVLFGYLAGLLVAALWAPFGRRVTAPPWVWAGVLLAGLLVGTALVFTPVVHWLVHLLR